MKKLFISQIFILLFSFPVYADQFIFTCISDKDFMTVYSIDTDKENIIHLSSKNLKNGDEYNSLNRKQKIIYWTGDLVYTFNLSSVGRENFMTIDLKNKKIVSTGHYVEKPDWKFSYAYSQYFDCISG